MIFHREASEIFAEIAKLGDQKAIFNRENCSIEVHNNDDILLEDEVDGSLNEIKGQSPTALKTNPLESIDTLKHFYLY